MQENNSEKEKEYFKKGARTKTHPAQRMVKYLTALIVEGEASDLGGEH